MKTNIHAFAGSLAFFLIFTFFTSTVAVELTGNGEAIANVKQWIVYGLFILVPAIAITGAMGALLSKNTISDLATAKKKRMPIIAANGILILIPAAIYLDHLAAAGDFGTAFYLVQALELLAGATNLTLMALNVRDGLRLTGRFDKARISSGN